MKKSLRIKDLIFIGIYTAVYFATVAVSALLVVFLIPGYSYAFIPIVSALFSGTIFMLMVSKVPRFGAITIMGSIMGLWFFIAGRFVSALLVCVVISLAADVIAHVSNYENKKGLLASYIVFSFSTIGPVIPMLLFPDHYVEQLIANGRDTAYIVSAFSDISQFTFIFLMMGIFVAAVLGGLFGQRMLSKHFEKAGIV